MKLYLVFDNSGGIIEDILLCVTAEAAEATFERMMGISHERYSLARTEGIDVLTKEEDECLNATQKEDMDAHIWVHEFTEKSKTQLINATEAERSDK